MDMDKLYDKLEQLSLGQQRIEDKLSFHLETHAKDEETNKTKFDRITKLYVPTFGVVIPTIISIISWFHTNHHRP